MKYQIKGDYLIIEINDDFAGMSVEQFFNYFHLSRKTIHLLKQNKQYALNNNFVTSNTLLKQGDSLKVLAFDQVIDYQFQSYPLTVVYEDDFILIVNKPINTAIYPEDKNGLNTLCNSRYDDSFTCVFLYSKYSGKNSLTVLSIAVFLFELA